MNFIRTLLNCCGSFVFYRNLIPLHPIKSIKFLAGLVLLVVLVQVGTFVPLLWEAFDKGADWVQTNLPRFEIRDGQAHYDSPEPFVYTNQLASIVLDTSGTTNRLGYTRPYGLFIERNTIRFGFAYEGQAGKYSEPRESQESLRGYPEGVVNGDYIRKLRLPWLWRITPFAVLLSFFGWMLAALIQAYIFTMVISFAESNTLRKFGFNEFFNIAVHACAPAVIVVTALIISRTYQFESLLLAFLATYFIYLMGATAACRREADGEKDRDGLA